jgi:hypothetical protein
MDIEKRAKDIRKRLRADDADPALRRDLRDLIVARLERRGILGYCAKESLSTAIGALREATGKRARAKLHFAFLQYQLSLLPEEARLAGHVHADELVDALTRHMLLEAVLAIE